MDRARFEAELAAEGYQLVERSMAAGTVNAEHAHGFDARLLILTGAMTIHRDGAAHTYGPGESCAVPAGARHAEQVGPEGVTYLAGRRAAAAAA